MSIPVSLSLFVLAGLCEIGGGYLVWLSVREGKPFGYAVAGSAILSMARQIFAVFSSFGCLIHGVDEAEPRTTPKRTGLIIPVRRILHRGYPIAYLCPTHVDPASCTILSAMLA